MELEFCLGRNGYIVVLEAGDNVRDLGNVGLNRVVGELPGSCPEYVELLNLGEGLQAYPPFAALASKEKRRAAPA
jgi:hypothetical protein